VKGAMDMARKAKLPAIEIADWAAADKVLGNVATDRACLAKIQAEADAKIEKVKADAKAVSETISAHLAAGLAALEAFTRAHEADLEGRSRKLTHGVLGLRQTTKIVLKRTVEFVLGALRARKMDDCIRLKEEVDKEFLDHYVDQQLAEVGCVRKTEDLFFADTDEVTL